MNGRVELHRVGPWIDRSYKWWAIDAMGAVVAERDGFLWRREAKREARRLFPGWPIVYV